MLYCSQLRETKGGSTLCGIAFFFLSQASPVKDAVHPSLVAMTEFEADCFPQKHSCFRLLIFYIHPHCRTFPRFCIFSNGLHSNEEKPLNDIPKEKARCRPCFFCTLYNRKKLLLSSTVSNMNALISHKRYMFLSSLNYMEDFPFCQRSIHSATASISRPSFSINASSSSF